MEKIQNIVILTGAGISAESGLATFRGADGLWDNYRVEDVASIGGFARNPELVHTFYNGLSLKIKEALPNAAHLAITKFQKERSDLKIDVVTQNVDLLHEKAGNQNIYHIHGRIDECVCLHCGHIHKRNGDFRFEDCCEKCGQKNVLKPNIVFFGEMPMFMDEVEKMLKSCDLFIAVGTSGVVYPAAGFVQTAKYFGAETYLFNLDGAENNFFFDRQILGKASVTLPEFLEHLSKKISPENL